MAKGKFIPQNGEFSIYILPQILRRINDYENILAE